MLLYLIFLLKIAHLVLPKMASFFSIWRPDPEDMGVKHYTLGYNGKYFESRINIWPQPFLISWQAFDDYLAEHLAYDDCHSCIKFFKDRCCQSRHKLT